MTFGSPCAWATRAAGAKHASAVNAVAIRDRVPEYIRSPRSRSFRSRRLLQRDDACGRAVIHDCRVARRAPYRTEAVGAPAFAVSSEMYLSATVFSLTSHCCHDAGST